MAVTAFGCGWVALSVSVVVILTSCNGDGLSWDTPYETNTYQGTAEIYAWTDTDTTSIAHYSERITVRIYDYGGDYRIVELNNATAIGDIGTSVSMADSAFSMDAQTIWSGESSGLNRLTRTYTGIANNWEVTGVVTGYNTIVEASGSGPQTGTFSAVWVGSF